MPLAYRHMVTSASTKGHPVERSLRHPGGSSDVGAHWACKRLLIHRDNHAVVDMWRSGSSRSKPLMSLVRTLFYTAASNNFTVLLQHIAGAENGVADALSRFQFCRFRTLAPEADLASHPPPAAGHRSISTTNLAGRGESL